MNAVVRNGPGIKAKYKPWSGMATSDDDDEPQ